MRAYTLFPRRFGNSITFYLLGLLLFTASIAQALEQNTAFLPLKINASAPDLLRQRADEALQKALLAKGFTMISRSQASSMANYTGTWPPKASLLSTIAGTSGYDYVATGSLTQLGERVSIDFSVFDLLQPQSPFTSFKEGNSRDLEALVNSAVTEALGYSNRRFSVASIAPAGNLRIDSGAILRKITTKPGDIYDPATLREDLKSVFSMGYFDNVEIEATDSAKGKNIIFRVQEKPLIGSLTITGTDHIKEKDVKDAANISENSILNPTKVNEAVTRIKELYKSKGYYNTTVDAQVSYPGKDNAEIQFVIDEGEKITIEEISFQGNKSFDADDLEDVIQTGTYAWWLSWLTDAGVLKMDILKQDAARVNAYYHNHGFIEAKVGDPIVEQKDGDLYVTFPIEEGPRYRVGVVDIDGDLIKDKSELIDMLKIREEPFLNRQTLREDATRLQDLYAENGYAFAEIAPEIKKAEEGQRVDIQLTISKGSLVYFNRIVIEGNTRTRENVIRRDLAVKEGGVFDSKAIRTSTQKLQRLGYFEEVNVTPKPTLNEDQMDVVVDVKEKATGQFSIGAGYSSSENLIFMGEIKEDNIFGTGNNLSLAANLSSTTTRYNLNFTNPRLFDSQISAGFELFNWEREYDDYTKDSTGAGINFGHPFWEKWRIYYGYTISDTDLTDISEDASVVITRSKDIHLTSEGRVSLVRDTRNHRFIPTSGSRNSIGVRYAGGPLGGDAQFTKVEGSSSWYFPLAWDMAFHVKAAAGQVFENEDDKLPVYEHFYLGGMRSIRGFDSLSISPIDEETGEKIGGDKMWYSNVSVIFPLVKDMGMMGEVFTDFGNVYAVEEDWDFGDYKKSAGVGILWLSPLGPLRLAWGYNLDQQDGEDSSNWDFSMGGTF
ncbi:outer membrane protein assembly factor BamA [Desulfogranum japonicum]|uniref:outer membrane protein assembly factor BamA n=1 Tax=Desulfogranum japonicum TaxID=231447 RepID=UPI00041F7D70|nr:outer membrane protein assembly factor BamA [Desulfogranum japonicum]